jgi:hypothetical protein
VQHRSRRAFSAIYRPFVNICTVSCRPGILASGTGADAFQSQFVCPRPYRQRRHRTLGEARRSTPRRDRIPASSERAATADFARFGPTTPTHVRGSRGSKSPRPSLQASAARSGNRPLCSNGLDALRALVSGVVDKLAHRVSHAQHAAENVREEVRQNFLLFELLGLGGPQEGGPTVEGLPSSSGITRRAKGCEVRAENIRPKERLCFNRHAVTPASWRL